MSEAMSGGGDYDRHSDHQRRDAASRAGLVVDAAERIVVETQAPVVLVDYGCGQGRTSNEIVRAAVETVRESHRDVPISVVHNDLLANDWATLVDDLRADDSYVRVPGGPIAPMICATSFYSPVVPPALVDLGVSFAALQWLSAPGPAGTGSALYFDQLTGPARAAMAARAHDDWTRFLELRADELSPGGRLVVDMMGVDGDGAAAGHDAWDEVRSICEDLVAEGALDRGRLDAYVIPIWERTLEEVRRPFAEDVGRRLELERLEIADSTSPASEEYRRSGDAAAFARDFVGFFRAFSEPSLRAALDLEGTVVDELYRRLETRLEANADDFRFVVHVVTAVITRT